MVIDEALALKESLKFAFVKLPFFSERLDVFCRLLPRLEHLAVLLLKLLVPLLKLVVLGLCAGFVGF